MNTLRNASFVRLSAILLLFVGLIISLGTIPPEAEAAPEDEQILILAIGDSITAGYDALVPDDPEQAVRASYRLPLYWLLKNYSGSKTYKFIGPKDKEYVAGLYHGDYNALDYTLIPYLGQRGDTTKTIAEDVVKYATPANLEGNVVALVQAGTNDVRNNMTAEEWFPYLEQILTHLKENKNPGMTIFLANIIPVNNNTDDSGRADETRPCEAGVTFGVGQQRYCDTLTNKRIDEFNNKLVEKCNPEGPGKFASRCKDLSGDGVNVYLVDQNMVNKDYDEPLSKVLIRRDKPDDHRADNIHPDVRGEAYMALRWYWALKEFSAAEPGVEDQFCTDWEISKLPCEESKTPYEGPCEDAADNLAANCGFSSGRKPWRFYSNTRGGRFEVSTANPYTGSTAAEVTVTAPGSNIQLYQSGIALQPNTKYELSFAAYSSDGRDMKVKVHKHRANYDNYGLDYTTIDLGTAWEVYTINFTTPNQAYMSDVRLRFWFAPYAVAGTVYHIDEVELVPAP